MVVITSTTNNVYVDMGALYPTKTQLKAGTWRKDKISKLFLYKDHVEVDASDGSSWLVNFEAGEDKIGLPVTSVDGVVPTSNEHLYTLLKNLL